ncbi:MAG: hypothetical protein OXB95_05265 [Rhodobacteraceae bacterium]|nr:hypothetical protein [Paracoccaceae bacterium]
MSGKLYFHKADQPQGFQNLATTSWDGNPEPIVRELLQNSLDASVEVKPSVEVRFTIEEVPAHKIPGIDAYRHHFEAASEERSKGEQGTHEKRVIDRIRRVLKKQRTRVLFCNDNGKGLNADRMKRILTEGNTDKASGAGSFGVGHLTAFAASDLRFIHYAGRSLENGRVQDVASAHAVLASRSKGENSGLGAHGFWLLGDDRTLFHQDPYPKEIPNLLQSQMPCNCDTGSVVCIVGFNNFRSIDENPCDAISRAAAKNFLVAIWNGQMAVRICDETDSSNEAITVNRTSLKSILKPIAKRKRAEQGGGWLSGEQAYRAMETLGRGHRIEFGTEGVHGYFRPMGNSAGSTRLRSRVQMFRNGMWITNDANKLRPRDFNGYKPFDAILEIDGGVGFGRLVREAEGPEHRGLDAKRLGVQRRRELQAGLEELANRLRKEAGEVEKSNVFTPTGFAVFRGNVEREAEKVPKFRPMPSVPDEHDSDEIEEEETTLHAVDRKRKDDPNPDPIPRHRVPRRPIPKRGKSVSGRCSVRAIVDDEEQIERLRVVWRPNVNEKQLHRDMFVRVRIPSGSDETCEAPIGPRWLKIIEVRCNGEVSKPLEDSLEVKFQLGEEPFTIVLAEPILDANAVEVDVVSRISAKRGGG